MQLDSAIRSSGVRVAVRRELAELGRMHWKSTRRREEERRLRVWERPFIAAKNLVKFDERTDQPVYETRVYTMQGQPLALALARRREDEDWVPIDPVDPITLLSNLADRDAIEARQRRITERKREIGVPEGREWTCNWFHELVEDDEPDDVVGFFKPPSIANV